ncbi:MAG: FAD-dependent oxidoreductase [Chloroflexi bacterium]|nr:FAD-dependent oxidoreductase [Chloroflexota bacterium]
MFSSFEYLFQPLDIGPVTARNRLMLSAHTTDFAVGHLPSERHAAYYAERARGGVGLIVQETQPVHPTSQRYTREVHAYDARAVEGYARIASAVHALDTLIFGQLLHSGSHGDGSISWLPLWSASPIPNVSNREIPKEMDIAEIRVVVRAFGDAAMNLKAGGYDGIELHGASSYLLAQFMSPVLNRRTDGYGGTLEKRLRLVFEVIEFVREQIGPDMALGIRLSGDELVPGGLTLEDMQDIAIRLEDHGQLDYVSVTLGSSHAPFFMIPPMAVPLGYAVYAASQIRRMLKRLPVFICGRINDPVQAEGILRDGHADMVGMVRPLICDPDLPNKARDGRLDDIRPCISCNQFCLARHAEEKGITCIQNPRAGRETDPEMQPIQPATVPRKVVVVGGGPAGMEAARVAALRGHTVTLYERENILGGQVNLAALLPTREEFGEIVRYLSRQINRLGVILKLGREATIEDVLAEGADAVVIATGSFPMCTGFSPARLDVQELPGVHQENVLTVWDVLRDSVPIGRRVVVIDEDGSWQGAGIAEFLLERGKSVEILTPFLFVGINLTKTFDHSLLYRRLFAKGARIISNYAVKAICGNVVHTYHVYSGAEQRIEDVDNVVLAMGYMAEDSLYRALKGKVPELYAVGDCAAPRNVGMAIYEGYCVGRRL